MLEKSSLKCGYFIKCVTQFKPYRFSMDLYQCVHRVVVIFLLFVFEEIISLKMQENTQMYYLQRICSGRIYPYDDQ